MRKQALRTNQVTEKMAPGTILQERPEFSVSQYSGQAPLLLSGVQTLRVLSPVPLCTFPASSF